MIVHKNADSYLLIYYGLVNVNISISNYFTITNETLTTLVSNKHK